MVHSQPTLGMVAASITEFDYKAGYYKPLSSMMQHAFVYQHHKGMHPLTFCRVAVAMSALTVVNILR
ncbi:hypothetical protein TTRE_0000875001 [Trichuris trichiura]|uniref:Uncharacterized protein n=1 Tax=Trichuris trichiura TaxID=36087 RepID=A0A077ZKX9_TRITR|nr:hypothetical protein TTRE_0000875001 [Trichuris trichiura]